MQIEFSQYHTEYPYLIDHRHSFEIVGVQNGDMLSLCAELENYIESQRLKCRIYTKNRWAALLSGVLKPQWGIFSAVAITAHNLFTYNPDYEIARDIANGRVCVKYKK